MAYLSGTLLLIRQRLAASGPWVAACAAAGLTPASQIIYGVGGFAADDTYLAAAGGNQPLRLPLAQVHLADDAREPAGVSRWQRSGSAFLDVVTATSLGISPDGYADAVQLADDLMADLEASAATPGQFAADRIELLGPPLAITTVTQWTGAWPFRLRLSWILTPRT